MKKGYFLVEMMVSLSIFTLIAVSTTGALLALIDVNIKAQGLKSVMDNLNVAVENMSRTIRFGTNYKCGGVVANGDCTSLDGFSFTAQDNVTNVRYYLSNDKIYRSINNTTGVEMTAPEVTITGLHFTLFGVGANDGQPRVFILIKGQAGLVASSKSIFNVQTTVSQRQPDTSL